MGWIYKITSPPGKCYVGQTTQKPDERWKQHNKSNSNCTLLKRAIAHHGKDNMKFEVVEEVQDDQLDQREAYWIEELKCLAPAGYNCSSGGNDKKVLSDELKCKIRDGNNQHYIDKNGYLGNVNRRVLKGGEVKYIPKINRNREAIYLSMGHPTEAEAIEVLKEYTRDPEGFKIPELSGKRKSGTGSISLHKPSGRFQARLSNRKSVGCFTTREEAERALERSRNSLAT